MGSGSQEVPRSRDTPCSRSLGERRNSCGTTDISLQRGPYCDIAERNRHLVAVNLAGVDRIVDRIPYVAGNVGVGDYFGSLLCGQSRHYAALLETQISASVRTASGYLSRMAWHSRSQCLASGEGRVNLS